MQAGLRNLLQNVISTETRGNSLAFEYWVGLAVLLALLAWLVVPL